MRRTATWISTRSRAGPQALTLAAGVLFAGLLGECSDALLMSAAWVIIFAVAEWAIRKPPVQPVRMTAAVGSDLH